MSAPPRILVVDNYDSFVYNLVQYLGELGALVDVARNDVVRPEVLGAYDGILISPGPGHPRNAGRSEEIIATCAEIALPLLGVCLGHQALADVFGAKVVRAPELRHGKSSLVTHDSTGIFREVRSPLRAGRYHSLVVDEATTPAELRVTARSENLVMGLAHLSLPLWGVQFHPESVLTEDGYLMLANWLELCGAPPLREIAQELSQRCDKVRRSLPVAESEHVFTNENPPRVAAR